MTKQEVSDYIMSQIFPNASHEVTAQNVRNAFGAIVDEVWDNLRSKIGDLSHIAIEQDDVIKSIKENIKDLTVITNAYEREFETAWEDIEILEGKVDTIEGKVDTIGSKVGEFDDKFATKEEVRQITPIVIEGDVTNAQDEEDITSIDGKLKFKDRSSIDGMGYVILRKDKSFAEQVTKANTIYEIRYEFDLNGGTVEIPEGCTLKFEGGNLRNGNISFENTSLITNGLYQIFDNVNFSGFTLTRKFDAEWFGASRNKTNNDVYLNYAIKQIYSLSFETGTHGHKGGVLVLNNLYNTSDTVYLRKKVSIEGVNKLATYNSLDERGVGCGICASFTNTNKWAVDYMGDNETQHPFEPLNPADSPTYKVNFPDRNSGCYIRDIVIIKEENSDFIFGGLRLFNWYSFEISNVFISKFLYGMSMSYGWYYTMRNIRISAVKCCLYLGKYNTQGGLYDISLNGEDLSDISWCDFEKKDSVFASIPDIYSVGVIVNGTGSTDHSNPSFYNLCTEGLDASITAYQSHLSVYTLYTERIKKFIMSLNSGFAKVQHQIGGGTNNYYLPTSEEDESSENNVPYYEFYCNSGKIVVDDFWYCRCAPTLRGAYEVYNARHGFYYDTVLIKANKTLLKAEKTQNKAFNSPAIINMSTTPAITAADGLLALAQCKIGEARNDYYTYLPHDILSLRPEYNVGTIYSNYIIPSGELTGKNFDVVDINNVTLQLRASLTLIDSSFNIKSSVADAQYKGYCAGQGFDWRAFGALIAVSGKCTIPYSNQQRYNSGDTARLLKLVGDKPIDVTLIADVKELRYKAPTKTYVIANPDYAVPYRITIKFVNTDTPQQDVIYTNTDELYSRSLSGATANRPTNVRLGFEYFDTTLNRPIWWNGTEWVDVTGADV